jgi:hypothetical protein
MIEHFINKIKKNFMTISLEHNATIMSISSAWKSDILNSPLCEVGMRCCNSERLGFGVLISATPNKLK